MEGTPLANGAPPHWASLRRRFQQFGAVLGRELLRLLHELSLRTLVEFGRRRRSGSYRNTNIGEEFLLSGRRTDAEQPDSLFRSVSERARRIGGNVYGFTRAHDPLLTAESGFDLAFKDGEGFLKVVAVRTWASARRNQHIDQAIAAIGVVARQQDCIGISDQTNVRQLLVLVRPREHQLSLGIVGRNRRHRLGGDCVLVHKSIRFWLLVAGLIFSGHSCLTCESQPLVRPIMSEAGEMSEVRFLKGWRPHFPSRLRARQIPG